MLILFLFLLIPINVYTCYYVRNIDTEPLIIRMAYQNENENENENILIDNLVLEPNCQLEIDRKTFQDLKRTSFHIYIKEDSQDSFSQETIINVNDLGTYSIIMNVLSASLMSYCDNYWIRLKKTQGRYFKTVSIRPRSLLKGTFIRNIDNNLISIGIVNNENLFFLKPNEELFIPNATYNQAEATELMINVLSGIFTIKEKKNIKPIFKRPGLKNEKLRSYNDDGKNETIQGEQDSGCRKSFILATFTIKQSSLDNATPIYNVCHGIAPVEHAINDDIYKGSQPFFARTFLNKQRLMYYYRLHHMLRENQDHLPSTTQIKKLKTIASKPDNIINK